MLLWSHHQMGLYQMHSQPVHTSYIERALWQFSHPPPAFANKHSPHAWKKPKYGVKVQFADGPSLAPILDATDTEFIQEIVGVLYTMHMLLTARCSWH